MKYETFKQACLMLHLIEDDREWQYCFTEAAMFSSGAALRDLFVTALTFGQLIDPVELWEEFCQSICDDLHHKLRQQFPNEEEKYSAVDETLFYQGSSSLDFGLYLIDKRLKELRFALKDYHMPFFINNWTADFDQLAGRRGASDNQLIIEQLDCDITAEKLAYEAKYAMFNADQKKRIPIDNVKH